MKHAIAHFGNQANDAFPVVEELQASGEDIHLCIPLPAHVTTLPQWELNRLEMEEIGNPYSPNMDVLNRGYEQPEWVHFFGLRGNAFVTTERAAKDDGEIRPDSRPYAFLPVRLPFAREVYSI